MAGASAKLPTWYRVLAIVVGVISIALALVVLVLPLLALWILIFFLAFALLVIGIDRLVAGVTGHAFGTAGPFGSLGVGGVVGPAAGQPPQAPGGSNPPPRP